MPTPEGDGDRLVALIKESMDGAHATMVRDLEGMFVGPPRFWVGLWRRWVVTPFVRLRWWLDG